MIASLQEISQGSFKVVTYKEITEMTEKVIIFGPRLLL